MASLPITDPTLAKQVLENSLLGHGKALRPFGGEGTQVKAIEQEALRQEFYRTYPADGATEKQKADTKRKAFQRAVNDAQERGLIAVREIGGVTWLWLAKEQET